MAAADAPHVELHTGDYPDLDPSKYISRNESFQLSKKSNLTDPAATMDSSHSLPKDNGVASTIADGPVAQSVKDQTSKTSSEFKDLANSRTTPNQRAATGQPLTQYHSMFYRLLSWKNPRATGITFASVILFIFAARYLNFLRYTLKALYMVLGLSASVEIAGKAMFGNGLTSQIRPNRYFTIPRDSLERFLDDLEQLINFFVIETQRIVFAENIYATSAAFVSAFISYWLIRWLPVWGLSLMGTVITFIGPLVYAQNKEMIDANLQNAGNVINKQAAQVRELAAQKTGRASETMKTYAGEYGNRAQGVIGTAKSKAAASRTGAANYSQNDFPNAPKDEPIPPTEKVQEGLAL